MSQESNADCPRSILLGVAIQTSGMGVWELSVGRGALTLDPRGCNIHGIDTELKTPLTLGQYLSLVHADDRWKLEGSLTGETLESFRELEFRLAEQSQGTRWVKISGDVEHDSEGHPIAIVGSCFDISEQNMVHGQLLQAQKMEAVGQLTAGIAHNFNNILSAVLPSLHLVAPHVKPEGEKFIRNAQLASERATALIAELMLVAGRKTGEARKALALADVVERVVRICRTTFGGWIQLNLECENELSPILGSESQIEQLLLNLLLNARDAFEEGAISCPRVDLEIEVEDQSIVLRVMDNGPGMDATTVQHIFEPFFTTKAAGTGLGLATAYAIVGEHGGTIECWSKPECGTEFRVKFPLHHGAVEVIPAKVHTEPVGGSERILVVDDDPLVRSATSAALRGAGYDVLEAKGGNEAIATQSADELIDLVVLDMAMPEITGDMVLEAMRIKDPEVRVLVFTGLSDARVGRLTGVAVLQKPAGVGDLLLAVRDAIDCGLN